MFQPKAANITNTNPQKKAPPRITPRTIFTQSIRVKSFVASNIIFTPKDFFAHITQDIFTHSAFRLVSFKRFFTSPLSTPARIPQTGAFGKVVMCSLNFAAQKRFQFRRVEPSGLEPFSRPFNWRDKRAHCMENGGLAFSRIFTPIVFITTVRSNALPDTRHEEPSSIGIFSLITHLVASFVASLKG